MTIKGIIPCSGLGTRINELTNGSSKELLQIKGISLLEYAIREMTQSGVEEIYITLTPKKVDITELISSITFAKYKKRFFKTNDKESLIELVHQKAPNGSGGAVKAVIDRIGLHDFVIVFPDVLMETQSTTCLNSMIKSFLEKKRNLVMVSEISQKEVERYGVSIRPNSYSNPYLILEFLEKPNYTPLGVLDGVIGRYFFKKSLLAKLEFVDCNNKNEIDLSVLLKKTNDVNAYIVNSSHFECGSTSSFIRASKQF